MSTIIRSRSTVSQRRTQARARARRSPAIRLITSALLASAAPAAVAVALTLSAATLTLAAPSPAHAGHNEWTKANVTAIRLRCLALSPTFPTDRTMLAAWMANDGDEKGGLARSTDGGRTWTKIGLSGPVQWVTNIVFSPDFANDRTIFVGSQGIGGTVDPGHPPVLWRSTDAGDTWSALGRGAIDTTRRGWFENRDLIGVSPDYARDRTVIAPTRTGYNGNTNSLGVSTDAGQTWKQPVVAETLSAKNHGPLAWLGGQELLCQVDGFMIRSVDGGARWSHDGTAPRSPAFSDYDYPVMPFVDANRGWLLDRYGGVRRTADGGRTWQSLVAESQDDAFWKRAMDFGDATHGIIVGNKRREAGAPVPMPAEYTTDGGQTWTAAPVPPSLLAKGPLSGIQLYDVAMVGPSRGWAVGSAIYVNSGPMILHTSDGGANWTEQAPPPEPDRDGKLFPEWTGSIGGVDFADAQNGWAVGWGLYHGYVILRTTNGGGTWSMVRRMTEEECPPLVDVRALSGSHAVVFGGTGVGGGSTNVVMTTTNGGGSWTSSSFTPGWMKPCWASFVDSQVGVIAGDDGLLARTIDGGLTWTQVSPTGAYNPTTFAFSPGYANDRVMVAQFDREEWETDKPQGTYRSTDGGWNWTKMASVPGAPGGCVEFSPGFASDRTMFVLSGGYAHRSTDAGASWTKLSMTAPVVVSPTYPSDATVLAKKEIARSSHSYSGNHQLFLSQDRGGGWTPIGAPATGHGEWRENVIAAPDYAQSRTVYTIMSEAVHAYSLRARRRATLSRPPVYLNSWDKRWVGWAVRVVGTIRPAHPGGWTTADLTFQKKVGRRWVTLRRVYPFKIDRRGRSRPVSRPRIVFSEITAKAGTNSGWVDHVFRETGTFRVRERHAGESRAGGCLTSYSPWTVFKITSRRVKRWRW